MTKEEKIIELINCLVLGSHFTWQDITDKQYIRVVLVGSYRDNLVDYTDLLPVINSRWKYIDGAAICNKMKAPIKNGIDLVESDIIEYKQKWNE